MIYEFICCDSQNMGCGHEFQVECSMDEITMLVPECPECNKFTFTTRNWSNERKIVNTGPQTLGALADKNSSMFSEDYKKILSHKYSNDPNKKDLQ